MGGLIIVAMAFASALFTVLLIGLYIGYSSVNQCLATFDALLLCAYFAAEFAHGGGNPMNLSGM